MKSSTQNKNVVLAICPVWNINQPPLSLAYIGAALSENGFNVNCYDFSHEFYNSIPEEERAEINTRYVAPEWFNNAAKIQEKYKIHDYVTQWSETILSNNPCAVGISVYSSTKLVSILLAKKIKETKKDIIVIFGGPLCNDVSLLDNAIDVLVYGEGETTITELLKSLNNKQSWKCCEGLIFKQGNSIYKTPARALINDLDSIPFPDWSLFDLSLYPEDMHLPMFTSRGCVGKCSFCTERLYWGKYRWRTAENIVAEMEHNVKEFGTNRFDITDSLINGNLNEFVKMCDLIIDKKLDVLWGGKARINPKMDISFLKKVRMAGCTHLIFGIESASQKVIDHMNKGIQIADVKRIITNCYEVGIRADLFFIVGYVNESEKDFQMTLDFIDEYSEYVGDIYPGSTLHIFPGSTLYNKRDEYGIAEYINSAAWISDNGKNTPAVRASRLDVLNKHLNRRTTHSIFADLKDKSYKKLVFYGAGKSSEYLITALQSNEVDDYLPNEIWDVNANSIKKLCGITVIVPEFSSVNEDYCIVITLSDEELRKKVISELELHNFQNYVCIYH